MCPENRNKAETLWQLVWHKTNTAMTVLRLQPGCCKGGACLSALGAFWLTHCFGPFLAPWQWEIKQVCQRSNLDKSWEWKLYWFWDHPNMWKQARQRALIEVLFSAVYLICCSHRPVREICEMRRSVHAVGCSRRQISSSQRLPDCDLNQQTFHF